MITSFKHKGLQKFYDTGSVKGIQPKHKARLRLQLAALDSAQVIGDVDLPGYRLHQLSGKQKGRWSITVNGNWKITIEFENGNAHIVDYEDDH